MIIGKKSFVIPTGLNLSSDERMKRIFNDRKILHRNAVPSFVIYIDESVWTAFLQKANEEYASHRNEASGIILGNYFKDEAGEYVVGTHFEAGNGSGTSSVFCEISIQDQLRILKTAKDKHLLQIIWIHSHPSFGAFYSTVDYRTLKSMYYAPHQAGIVVDNVKDEYLGFKVRNSNAYEFKDIYLIKLMDGMPQVTRPFGKKPVKIFFAKKRESITLKKKLNETVSLKGKCGKINEEADILSLLLNAIDDLKVILLSNHETKDKMNQFRLNWEASIKGIEELVNKQYGEKPYKDVAPVFNLLNEMRNLLDKSNSPESQASLLDKVNEILTVLTKS